MDTQDGFVMLPNLILQNKALTPTSIVLYCNLMHFDRGNGNGCFTKKKNLAKFCNMSLFQVRAALKLLEDNGIISILKRYNGLTDVIKIVPDCRPPVKTKHRSSTGVANRDKQSRQPIELKNPPPSTNTNNTNTNNNTLAPHIAEAIKETTEKDHILDPLATAPIPQDSKDHILDQLKHQIRPRSWKTWFEHAFIEKETDNQVDIFTPKGFYVADWINGNYINLIESIAGKRVRILSKE